MGEGERGPGRLLLPSGAVSCCTSAAQLGLIATNTVAQGDTREVGLDAMVARWFTITRAIQVARGRAVSANLEYAAVWGSRRHVADAVPRSCDDVAVAQNLDTAGAGRAGRGHPVRLDENSGIAFQGCIVLGHGFVLDRS